MDQSVYITIATLSALAGLSGVVIGSFLNGYFSRFNSRKQNTFLLNNEFHSNEMLKSRIKADQLLKNYQGTLVGLRNSEPEDFHHVSRVLHFFDQLDILSQSALIDKDLARSLFGYYYKHFGKYFEIVYKAQLTSKRDEWSPLISRISDLDWLLEKDESTPLSLSLFPDTTAKPQINLPTLGKAEPRSRL